MIRGGPHREAPIRATKRRVSAMETHRFRIIRTNTGHLGLWILPWMSLGALTAPLTAAADPPPAQAPAFRSIPGSDDASLRARFPDADAVVLRWERHFTLHRDSSITRREHRWVKLLDSRAARREADPRITYHRGQDRLTIHAARTHLPDGGILDVPDYALNLAAPEQSAGWPAFGDWVQRVVSFSGVDAGVVLELDYEITTQFHVLPWLEAEIRLHDDNPVLQAEVMARVPTEGFLQYDLTGLEAPAPQYTTTADWRSYRWTFGGLDACPDEPHSVPWQQRCGRLLLTSRVGTGAVWLTAVLDSVQRSAEYDDGIAAWVQKVVEGETEPRRQIERLTLELREAFTWIDVHQIRRSLQCRPAGEVALSRYGHVMEAGPVLIAGLRSLGLQFRPLVAVDAAAWNDTAVTFEAFEGIVAAVELDGQTLYVHPTRGELRNPGSWGGRLLLEPEPGQQVRRIELARRGEGGVSLWQLAGRLKLSDTAELSGTLDLLCTGACFDPETLQTADQQKSFLQKNLDALASGLKVTGYSVTELSEDRLAAELAVAAAKPLVQEGGLWLLEVNGPGALPAFGLPAEPARRRTPLRLPGALQERMDLTIELPAGMVVAALPETRSAVEQAWGRCSQEVTVQDQRLRWRRELEVRENVLDPELVETLRRALAGLRAAGCRLAAFSKS